MDGLNVSTEGVLKYSTFLTLDCVRDGGWWWWLRTLCVCGGGGGRGGDDAVVEV